MKPGRLRFVDQDPDSNIRKKNTYTDLFVNMETRKSTVTLMRWPEVRTGQQIQLGLPSIGSWSLIYSSEGLWTTLVSKKNIWRLVGILVTCLTSVVFQEYYNPVGHLLQVDPTYTVISEKKYWLEVDRNTTRNLSAKPSASLLQLLYHRCSYCITAAATVSPLQLLHQCCSYYTSTATASLLQLL